MVLATSAEAAGDAPAVRPKYFARPTLIGDSFEARFHHIPHLVDGKVNGNLGADTDVYEYHWSYRMKDNRLKDLAGVAYRTLLPTKHIWHLLVVVVFLSVAGGIVGVARGAWSLPSRIIGLDLSGISTNVSMWFTEDWITVPLPSAWGILVLALVVLVAGVTYGGLHRRSPWRRAIGAVIATVAVGAIGTVIVGGLSFTDRRLVNGGAVALVLVAIALLFMVTLTPAGLRATWIIAWIIIVAVANGLVLGHWKEIVTALSDPKTIPKVLFGGAGAFLFTQLLGRVAPWLTTSFVDVVRYVDTSPRSYEVRRDIRIGLVDLLEQLHNRPPSEQYDRILVVAHSLGSYISYDAISSLWYRRVGPVDVEIRERPEEFSLDEYRVQQAEDFAKVAETTTRSRCPVWRIAHLLTFGSPMYLADTLVSKTAAEFRERRDQHLEFFTCPPPDDVTLQVPTPRRRWQWFTRLLQTQESRVRLAAEPPGVTPIPEVARREVAAFGVVQWTNLWYPVSFGLFGDPFGGRLARLFGDGIKDIEIRDGFSSCVPYAAHAAYTMSKPGQSGGNVAAFYDVVQEAITFPSGAPDGDFAEEE
jgi:hypothetical protein